MSAMPPEQPLDEARPVGYATVPQDERNGVAIAALVVGILGLAFPPLGLVALVLGIVGLVRANSLVSRKGRGLAIAAIGCGGVGLVLLPYMFDALFRTTGTPRRTVCASNLKGIGQGLQVYAYDNSDWYPVAPFTETTTAVGNTHAVTFIGQMANNLMARNSPAQQSTVHPSRSLFMLIIDGTCIAKQFVCPSSGDAEDDMRTGAAAPRPLPEGWDPGETRFDFRGYPYLSYGYQLPFGPHAQPSEKLDPRMVIMADKGPFFTAGSGATGFESWTVRDALRQGPGMPPAGGEISLGLDSATSVLKADHDMWRPFNSRNHGQEGENVLYRDGSVHFATKPIVGVNYDNIYTMQGGYALENSLLGRVPADRLGPLTQTDSVIVP